MFRAIGSILTGFVTWTVLFLSSNAVIAWLLPTPAEADALSESTGVLLLILALSILCSIIAGWITFKVDRIRALGMSLILGALLLAFGACVQIQYWDQMPLWYHLSFRGALIPGVLLGYRLAVTRT